MIYNKKVKLPSSICYGLFIFSCQNKDRSQSISDKNKSNETEPSSIVDYQDPTDRELKKFKEGKKKLEDKIKENEKKIDSLQEELKKKENELRTKTSQNNSNSNQYETEKRKLEDSIKNLQLEKSNLEKQLNASNATITSLNATLETHIKSVIKLISYRLTFFTGFTAPGGLTLNSKVNIKNLTATNSIELLKNMNINITFVGGIKADVAGVGQNQIEKIEFPKELAELASLFDITKTYDQMKNDINAKYPGLIP